MENILQLSQYPPFFLLNYVSPSIRENQQVRMRSYVNFSQETKLRVVKSQTCSLANKWQSNCY